MIAPSVSIGLPVFNGASMIEGAVRSILAQDFRDFELIISDNASTDDTQAICEGLARSEPRIRYVRQETNLGAIGNFRFVLDAVRAPLFMWRAHDDVSVRAFLPAAVAELMRDPHLACVQGRSRFVLGEKTVFRQSSRLNIARGQHSRFFLAREPFGKCMFMYGLFRTHILREADWAVLPDHESWWWNDALFLQSILAKGGFRRIEAEDIRYRLKIGTGRGAVVQERRRSLLAKHVSYHPPAYLAHCIRSAPKSLRWQLWLLTPLKILKSNVEAWLCFAYLRALDLHRRFGSSDG